MKTDERMSFLVNENIQFIWELRKAGDKNTLEEFRERLADIVSFADVELHELEIKNRITALLDAGIDENTADELVGLAKDVHGHGLFFLFQKNLETLVEAMQDLAFVFDKNKMQKELKAKIKALCDDVDKYFIDDRVADRLSELSDEVRNYLSELPDDNDDEQAVYERLKAAMAEEAQA